jgi:hypothetical protein
VRRRWGCPPSRPRTSASAPYVMTLKVRTEKPTLFAGARRVAAGEFTFTSPDLLQILDAFNAMK